MVPLPYCRVAGGAIDPEHEKTGMMDKKTALIAQVFMTFMMALSMSGIMSVIELGPTVVWLNHWPKIFLIAWPTAFVLTMVAWPTAMALARKVAKPALEDDLSAS